MIAQPNRPDTHRTVNLSSLENNVEKNEIKMYKSRPTYFLCIIDTLFCGLGKIGEIVKKNTAFPGVWLKDRSSSILFIQLFW